MTRFVIPGGVRRRSVSRLVGWAAAFALAACAQGAYPTGVLLDQASLDLTCPRDSLAVSEKTGGQHQARGCGRAATYEFDSTAQRWRMVQDDGMIPGPRR